MRVVIASAAKLDLFAIGETIRREAPTRADPFVQTLVEYLASGMSEAAILADFPSLKPEHIRAVLAFAAERERRLAVPPAA